MTSTLSSSNIDSLKILGTLGEEEVKIVVDSAIRALIHPENEEKLSEQIINAQFGIASLICIFARQSSIADALKPVLKDSGLSQNSIDYVMNAYSANVDIIRGNLANITVSYPKITGCDWRLDYSVSNSESGSVLKPIFFIKLSLEGNQSIDFTCTEEEMTALVTSLKDAVAEASRTTL